VNERNQNGSVDDSCGLARHRRLVMALEEEFETEIPDEEAKRSHRPAAIDYCERPRQESLIFPRPSRFEPPSCCVTIGIVCPIGNTVAEAWSSVLAAKSASAASPPSTRFALQPDRMK